MHIFYKNVIINIFLLTIRKKSLFINLESTKKHSLRYILSVKAEIIKYESIKKKKLLHRKRDKPFFKGYDFLHNGFLNIF